jgi:glycine betaine/choline ABC-type transport system substrate-binding protein
MNIEMGRIMNRKLIVIGAVVTAATLTLAGCGKDTSKATSGSSGTSGGSATIASGLILGGPPEFKTRSDGIAGLKATYGLTFKQFDPLDESGPITVAALTGGKVQAADVFTTTPAIISDKLVSLGDPKSNFAAQNVIPLVYKPAMTPTITSVLNAVDAKLTTAALVQMVNAVVTDKQNYTTVAQGFIQSAGLS